MVNDEELGSDEPSEEPDDELAEGLEDEPADGPADEPDELVGTAQVASMLGVSRQRADQLTRSKGFPDPIRRVILLDAVSMRIIREVFKSGEISITLDEALELFFRYASLMPATPRLWRKSVVKDWADERGREVAEE